MIQELGQARFRALGTDAVVLTTDHGRLGVAVDAVRHEIEAIDRSCSRFRDDSELSTVNAADGREVEVSDVLLDAVEVALRAASMTRGVVDPTVGQVLEVLGYDRDFAAIATGAAPVVRVARIAGWRRVRVDRERRTIGVPAGTHLDLGATAKALAADRAAQAAADRAGCGVLVSLGGDISTAGHPPAHGWHIRVTDWQGSDVDAEGESVAIFDGALATSSTTVRRWWRGDQVVHHLVDPATGAPAPEVWRTVSVAAADCVDANVASTASIILGEAAPEWLASTALPARLVRADGDVVHLNGWGQAA